jgi:hypothetical protein
MSWRCLTKKLSLNVFVCETCYQRYGIKFSSCENYKGTSLSFACVKHYLKKNNYLDPKLMDQRNIPPILCECYLDHFKTCREMLERKGKAKKKINRTCLSVDVCKSCHKDAAFMWCEDDNKLWKDYKYIRCQRIISTEGEDYELVDGMIAPPAMCPYSLEHMVLSKKNHVGT